MLEEELVPNPSGRVCGVCECSSSGQALHSPAAPGEGELLIPSVTTAKDFTATLEILGMFFLKVFSS